MNPEQLLVQLGLELPPVPKPNGLYRPIVTVGGLAYVSGHAPLRGDGSRIVGRLGADLDLVAGQQAARQSGLAILATLRHHLGSLERVRRVVKVFGMINATPDFVQHPAVLNGCSELFAQVFGEPNGIGARSAAGMSSLPGNIAVEIEAMFEVET